MSIRRRIFVGSKVRNLRNVHGLDQSALARKIGVSVSYLSQIENDRRPLTASVMASLGRHFAIELASFEADENDARFDALSNLLDDPLFTDDAVSPESIMRAVDTQPRLVDRFIALHRAYRQSEERLQILNEVIDTGSHISGRLPWDSIRDWFHESGNYIDLLDRRAEVLAEEIGLLNTSVLAKRLSELHGITIEMSKESNPNAPLRQLDKVHTKLHLSAVLSPESFRFQLAYQLVSLELAAEISDIVRNNLVDNISAQNLLTIGLTNYAASSLLMPYEKFRKSARVLRHDIDRLCRDYMVSFEQACHRLSTLQRPSSPGIPFFFCRVDMAGNITKRHSATRLEFARFGGACPLWVIHEAVAIPDRIVVQLAQTPDNVHYIMMAKGLVKPSGSYEVSPRRYAVALGCEATHAPDFIYADRLDSTLKHATPIGSSCRVCPRSDCQQRAFPPIDRAIRILPDRRNVVPYDVG